jgi:hypothetical protein
MSANSLGSLAGIFGESPAGAGAEGVLDTSATVRPRSGSVTATGGGAAAPSAAVLAPVVSSVVQGVGKVADTGTVVSKQR